MDARYLFIVGLGRSGSKLVQNVLRLSPGLTVISAGETKYMGSLLSSGLCTKIRNEAASGAPNCLERIADLCINESPSRGVWIDLKSGRIPRGLLVEELRKNGLSEKGVYESVLRLRDSSADGNVLRVDKTPQNLYHVETILSWFPAAKIVHMIRDPRGVLASAWTRRMREYPDRVYFSVPMPRPLYSVMIVFHVAFTWLYAVHLHRRYIARYSDKYLLIRFEDLVSSPDPTIRQLTSFLNVEHDAAMVNPPSKGSSFGSEVEAGMDMDTLNRWEIVLKPWMRSIVTILCRKSMRDVGYG